MSVLRNDVRPPMAIQEGHTATASLPKRKVLAVVDGSARAADVLEFVTARANGDSSLEVIVLNVQPAPEDWRLRGYGSFKQEEIRDRLINDRGKPIVMAAARQLDRARIAHRERIEIGEAAETIERCGREEGCDEIVVAAPPGGALRRWLARRARISIGSVGSQLVELADRPVVVVR